MPREVKETIEMGQHNSAIPEPVSITVEEGLELVGELWGHLDGPTVFLLHGGGQTRHAWTKTAHALRVAGYSALAIDLRGHGDSNWARSGDYRMGAFADDLLQVRAEIGAPVAVVGASLGGLAALLAQEKGTGNFTQGLVLVDIVPNYNLEGARRIRDFMVAYPDGFGTLNEAGEAVAEFLPNRPRPMDLSGLRKNLRKNQEGRLIWHWDPKFMEGTRISEAQEDKYKLEDAARHLAVPTLLIRGSRSDVVDSKAVEQFLDLVPKAAHADVSNASHMVAGDNNDAFLDVVLHFLRTNAPS